MKKALSIILVLALACSLFGGAALAAASDYVLTGGSVTVDGTEDKTVEVAFTSVKGGTYYSFSGNWSLKETQDSSYLTLTALSKPKGATENSTETGRTQWTDMSFSDGLTVAANGAIWTATYTVDKNTPSGTYTVSLNVDGITGGSAGFNAETDAQGLKTATITVTNPTDPDPDPTPDPNANGYTVTVKADKTTVATGGTVLISLDVANSVSTVTEFYVIDLVLTYENANFTYDASNSTLPSGLTATASGGELTIQRYGSAIALQDGAEFKLAFTADSAAENCEFKVTKAQIDTANNANQDAPEASVSGTPKVTVSQTYTVTFKGGSGTTGTAPTLTSGNTVADGSTITLPNNTFKKEGWTFSKWSDGKNEYDEGDEYTVTGDVTFTAQWSKNYTVAFEGGTGATGNPPELTGGNTVADGTEIRLPNNTFSKDGYTFSKWSDGQNEYGEGAKYTVTGDVTFTAQWTENTPDPKVTVETNANYCDGYTLIKATIENADGNVPTYKGEAMFKVKNVTGESIYDENAYYYVEKTADYDAGLVSYAKKSVETITKDGDANQTGRVDINDAQFIYNLYNGVSVTYNMSVEQLLASDVNGDGKVGTDDCAAAIDKIQ